MTALCPRELQCLERVAKGMTNKAIATDLHLSFYTVGTYLNRLFGRLGAHDRAHAVAIGYQLGILPLIPTPERSV